MPTKRLTRTRTVTKTIYPDDCTGEDNMRDMFGSLRSKLSYNDDHFKDITMSPLVTNQKIKIKFKLNILLIILH